MKYLVIICCGNGINLNLGTVAALESTQIINLSKMRNCMKMLTAVCTKKLWFMLKINIFVTNNDLKINQAQDCARNSCSFYFFTCDVIVFHHIPHGRLILIYKL